MTSWSTVCAPKFGLATWLHALPFQCRISDCFVRLP